MAHPQRNGDGPETEAGLTLENSLPTPLATATQPWAHSLELPGSSRSESCCQGLSQTAPATQGAREAGTSPSQPPPAFPLSSREKIKRHLPTAHFLPSFLLSGETPAQMQKPHCWVREAPSGPVTPRGLGLGDQGPPSPGQGQAAPTRCRVGSSPSILGDSTGSHPGLHRPPSSWSSPLQLHLPPFPLHVPAAATLTSSQFQSPTCLGPTLAILSPLWVTQSGLCPAVSSWLQRHASPHRRLSPAPTCSSFPRPHLAVECTFIV